MLSIDQLKEVIRELDAMKAFEITLTGGEPTIRKGFWNLLDVVGEVEFSTITLITNAANIALDKYDKIIDSGIDSIRVSIDGTRQTFEDVRLVDRYDQVLKNSMYLNERVSSFKVLTTVMKTNVHNLFELTDELRRAGIKRQDYILVRAHGRGGRNNLLLSEKEVMDLQEAVHDFHRKVPQTEFDLRLNAPYLSPVQIAGEPHDVVMFPYLVPDSSVAVSATGDVTMSRLTSSKPLGNVKDRPIAEIWEDAQSQLSEEVAELSEEELRRIYWNFADGEDGANYQHTALLDRQIFEGFEVR